MHQNVEKLRNIGSIFGLSEQESTIFAYKVLGMRAKDIKEKTEFKGSHYAVCTTRIYEKLEITTKSREERLKIIQDLGKEALKRYDDLFAPAISHNAIEMTAALRKLNDALEK